MKNKWLDFQKKSINWQNDLDIILKEWDWFSSISDIIIKHLNKTYWIWSLEENSSYLFENWIELSQSKIKEDIESNFLKKIDLSFWSIIDSDESEILYHWTSEFTIFKQNIEKYFSKFDLSKFGFKKLKIDYSVSETNWIFEERNEELKKVIDIEKFLNLINILELLQSIFDPKQNLIFLLQYL